MSSATASVQKKLFDYARDYAVEKISIKLDKAKAKQRARALAREENNNNDADCSSAESSEPDENSNIYYIPNRNVTIARKKPNTKINIKSDSDNDDDDNDTDPDKSVNMKLMKRNYNYAEHQHKSQQQRQKSVRISGGERNTVTTTRNFRSITSQAMSQYNSKNRNRSVNSLAEDDEDDAYMSAQENIFDPMKIECIKYNQTEKKFNRGANKEIVLQIQHTSDFEDLDDRIVNQKKSQQHWNKVSTLVKGMPPTTKHIRHNPPASPTRLRGPHDPHSPSVNEYSGYIQKKSLAQGMMDLALVSANTNQLRYILEYQNHHPYFAISLALVILSLFMQVAVGMTLIWNTKFNVKERDEMKEADRVNNISVIGIFMVTLINVFLSTFGGAPQNPETINGANGGANSNDLQTAVDGLHQQISSTSGEITAESSTMANSIVYT